MTSTPPIFKITKSIKQNDKKYVRQIPENNIPKAFGENDIACPDIKTVTVVAALFGLLWAHAIVHNFLFGI